MTNKSIPEASTQFLDVLLSGGTEFRMSFISEGITCLLQNTHRLFGDVRCLVNQQRYATARFLLTTAIEEIAKIYILLDMVRLDIKKHRSVAKKLCAAFYDHISKHAYYEVQSFDRLRDIEHAYNFWEIETKKFWKGDFFSGEPDMPHDTYFSRQLPLFVDCECTFSCWSIPENKTYEFFFKPDDLNVFMIVKSKFGEFEYADYEGLFTPESLNLLHLTFKDHYINMGVKNNLIFDLYRKYIEKICRILPIDSQTVQNSPLVKYPIYHFLTIKSDN